MRCLKIFHIYFQVSRCVNFNNDITITSAQDNIVVICNNSMYILPHVCWLLIFTRPLWMTYSILSNISCRDSCSDLSQLHVKVTLLCQINIKFNVPKIHICIKSCPYLTLANNEHYILSYNMAHSLVLILKRKSYTASILGLLNDRNPFFARATQVSAVLINQRNTPSNLTIPWQHEFMKDNIHQSWTGFRSRMDLNGGTYTEVCLGGYVTV